MKIKKTGKLPPKLRMCGCDALTKQTAIDYERGFTQYTIQINHKDKGEITGAQMMRKVPEDDVVIWPMTASSFGIFYSWMQDVMENAERVIDARKES